MSKANLFWIILGLVAVAAIVYVAVAMKDKNSSDTGNGSDGENVYCTLDAKLCPDGSYVGRVAPSCDFAPCPGNPEPTPQAPSGY